MMKSILSVARLGGLGLALFFSLTTIFTGAKALMGKGKKEEEDSEDSQKDSRRK